MIFLKSQDMFCSWVCIFSFANHFLFWILCTSNDSNLFTGFHILMCILIFLLISNFVERKGFSKMEGKYCSWVLAIIWLFFFPNCFLLNAKRFLFFLIFVIASNFYLKKFTDKRKMFQKKICALFFNLYAKQLLQVNSKIKKSEKRCYQNAF